MVTVVYKVVIKTGSEEEFRKVALKCEECAHMSEECLYYSFFRSLDNPREFLVYYRFKTKSGQDKHIEKLREVLGPSPSKRDLPHKFLDLLSAEEVILFKTT